MDLNQTIPLIGDMFRVTLFGSLTIVAIFLVIFFIILAIKFKLSVLDFMIVFSVPALIVMGTAGFDFQSWISPMIIILSLCILAFAFIKFFFGR